MTEPYYGATSHPDCGEKTGHTCAQPSGRTCVEPKCDADAGTHWGPMWCPDDDARRLDRVSAGFAAIKEAMEG